MYRCIYKWVDLTVFGFSFSFLKAQYLKQEEVLNNLSWHFFFISVRNPFLDCHFHSKISMQTLVT